MTLCAKFFDSLPADQFLLWEEELRTALLLTVQEHGRQTLWKVVTHPKVTFLATAVVETWIEKRVGGEFEVGMTKDHMSEVVALNASENDRCFQQPATQCDAHYIEVMKMFLSTMPQDYVMLTLQEQTTWRDLYNKLITAQCPVRLSGIGRYVEETKETSDVSPACNSIRKWCIRRVVMSFFGEFFDALPSDYFLDWEEELRSVLLSSVNRRGRQLLSKLVALPKSTSIAVTAIQKWVEKRVGAEFAVRRSKDNRLEIVGLMHSDEVHHAHLIDKEEYNDQRMEAIEGFFSTLPQGTFIPEEHAMWMALYTRLGKAQCPIRLSDLDRFVEVESVRSTFLPDSVTIYEWCVRRASRDFEITGGPDNPTLCLSKELEMRRSKNQKLEVVALMVYNDERRAHWIQKEERDAQRKKAVENFFSTLPQERFIPEEHAMWTALYGILSQAQYPIRLCDIGRYVEIKNVRSALLPGGVTIREWCVQRAARDFEIGGGRDNPTLSLSREHKPPWKRLRGS